MRSVNEHNVGADKLAYGKWASLNGDYFANPKIIRELYSFLEKENIAFGESINIIDLGGAEGMVGEYFAKQLNKSREVILSILDIVKEHLLANNNPRTNKIHQDLLKFTEKNKYDLGIMSSVLHYFSKNEQLLVLKNIRQSIKKSGVLLLKVFTQHPENMDLFHTLNRKVGKNLKLINTKELEELLEKAEFSEVKLLGDATTWDCSESHLQKRYQLTNETLAEMAEIIKKAPSSNKTAFTVRGNRFTIPIPYKVYLLRK